MILGIDASNIRRGGGVTHLVELLRAGDPTAHGFSRVVVWSGRRTLEQIEDRPWLVKPSLPLLDGPLPRRVLWQRFRLSALARSSRCDVLFVPGGSYAGNFRPMVTMSQNLLPFEAAERRRYGASAMAWKLRLLGFAQRRTFRQADGLIFLTAHAAERVMRSVRATAARTIIIPHGLDRRFFRGPREQRAIDEYSADRPFRLVYVSIIDLYKHQWHVADAVARLRTKGIPVSLDLVGPAYAPALARLKRALRGIKGADGFLRYLGPVPHAQLAAQYGQADLCVFASSCENMPNILLEGMASGLPIASSGRGPMPEMLGDAGLYFDPENPADIARVLEEMVGSPVLRAELAQKAFARAGNYSWQRCSDRTMKFLSTVAAAKPSPGLTISRD